MAIIIRWLGRGSAEVNAITPLYALLLHCFCTTPACNLCSRREHGTRTARVSQRFLVCWRSRHRELRHPEAVSPLHCLAALHAPREMHRIARSRIPGRYPKRIRGSSLSGAQGMMASFAVSVVSLPSRHADRTASMLFIDPTLRSHAHFSGKATADSPRCSSDTCLARCI